MQMQRKLQVPYLILEQLLCIIAVESTIDIVDNITENIVEFRSAQKPECTAVCNRSCSLKIYDRYIHNEVSNRHLRFGMFQNPLKFFNAVSAH